VNATVIIPARYESTRYRAKPLALIKGASGETKTLLQRTWEVGVASGLRTIISTDHDLIADLAVGFGAEVCITPSELRNGTERCAYTAAYHQLQGTVINLQGDACLTPPEWLKELEEAMDSAELAVSTIVSDFAGAPPPADVVAFSDIYGYAHHFARSSGAPRLMFPSRYEQRHFGVYAYRRSALNEYLACGETPLETAEGLEQMRWGRLGVPIKLVWAPEGVRLPVCEVNTPGDVPRVEEELRRRGIE
jgi:3-deoxy-manno-octulosonate cytidylyltransferase (CMP-KDO synthetase)